MSLDEWGIVEMKKGLYGLDVLRIISALTVCAFHTNIHLGAKYGFLTDFVSMGAVFMTLFFMLSGYSLFISNAGKTFTSNGCLKRYFKKRFFGIMPMYYIAALIYVIAEFILSGGTLLQTLLLFPVELLGIQSVFASLFSLSHNGGTWFISCILICYLLYPALHELVLRMGVKHKIIIQLIIIFVLLYSPFIVWYFECSSIYSNPFFRLLEFFLGVIIASMRNSLDDIEFVRKYLYNWISVVIISFLMIIGVTVAVKLHIAVGNYLLYSWVCLPCFIALIIALSGISFEKIKNRIKRIIVFFSEMTYCLFLAQLFSNKISKFIIHKFSITNNLIIIFIGWSVCIVITVFLHEGMEKRLKLHFNKFLLE